MKKVFSALLLLVAFSASFFSQTTPTNTQRSEAYLHFTKARMLAEQGQVNDSIAEYKKALDLDPGNSEIYSGMAETYMRAQRVREAVDAAQKAVKADPDNIDAHKILASVYTTLIGDSNNNQPITEDTINQAVHEFEEIARIDPSDQQSYLMLGRLYQIKNDSAKAEEIYKKFLGLEPGSEDGITALARLYMDGGNNKEAVSLLENYVKDHQESDAAYDALAQAYASLEQFDKAAAAYRKVLDLDPDNVDTKKALAQALFFDNKYDDAATLYLDLLKLDPNDGMVLLRLGQIYREQKRYGQSHVYMQKAVQNFPDSIEVQFNMMLLERDEGILDDALSRVGDILKKTASPNGKYSEAEKQNRRMFLVNQAELEELLGQYDDEVKSLTELKTVTPATDGRIDRNIIDAYRAGKNLDKALAYSEQVLKENPDAITIQIAHADMIAEKGRLDDGIKTLQQMLKGTDQDLEILATMANAYQRAKKSAQAQTVAETIVKQFPNDANAYFQEGSIYDKQKKFTEAEAAFRKSLEIEKDNPDVLNYLGYMLADRGVKLDEAIAMIQKAVDQAPTNGAFLDSLGWAYFRANKLDLAEEYLRKALRFAGTDATVNEHMGDLYYKTQRLSEAKAAWTKSVQLGTDPEEIAKVRKKLDDLKTKSAKE